MDHPPLRNLIWVGSSKKEYLRFPADAVKDFGQQLYMVQAGQRAPGEKLLVKGSLKGLGIRELRVDFDRDTYRVMYTVKLGSGVYVLHAFKKKSRFGISTPVHEMQVVQQRYLDAVKRDSESRLRSTQEDRR